MAMCCIIKRSIFKENALTDAPSQVLAIFEKDAGSEKYETIKHVAKGLNLNNVQLTDEISNMIDLKNYVYKGK